MTNTQAINQSAPTPLSNDKGKETVLAKLEKAAKDFEGYFVGYVFQKAYSSIEKSDLLGGGGANDMYQSMFIEELSKSAATSKNGFGVSEAIMKQLKKRYGYEDLESLKQEVGPLAQETQSWAHNEVPTFTVPEEGVISSGFGKRVDPLHGHARHHDGIDIALPLKTPIKAAASGEVVFSGKRGGYGESIMIKHGENYTTFYAHNSQNTVKVGQKVEIGEIIGYSGNTGRSTGPHLHFEVLKDGKKVNPEKFIKIENKS